ncbi:MULTISPECIES: BLUF domain-containing protein [Bradyrhizobium]|uniref:BLUF domain-containing protein n=1 Tax=Bradyrhizobium TaxID=374 RepID=UPI00155F11A4|nr:MULTISPECIES: BLUF domain-containing protein [Bradyrhizobium]MDD1518281.1 blue light sensor protein [Bradyrhizobium sp. WBAH30]MDD1540373.1 blue light sensor protein [Bradyrhizobium sp. WBAH41]MDD1556182.1 blue light sensor protein [Bradyrhizobium sp. WBAH23]MDD1563007.1 blue light sensor protein [Bradyrhizobium sp. WBAH33]MDD1588490.1 blue light sensor protein [Bradyrhizobium sp. WBAH42]
MLATWLYVSSSLLGQDADAEIANIRSIAEARNPELRLTGVLLFSGRHFAQFLEGAEADLNIMQASICSDARHTGLVTLPTDPIGKRRYGRWALAYLGWASHIDGVLSDALLKKDGRKLLRYMDEFVAQRH